MSKVKYVCSSCGYESGKWYGKCPECGSWNSFDEVKVSSKKSIFQQTFEANDAKPQKISDIKSTSEERISTKLSEFDRVLGGSLEKNCGGIVPGSAILLAGDPGVGKSTLLLQLALNLSKREKVSDSNPNNSVLYVTGEESDAQVKMRAERLLNGNELHKSNLFIFPTSNIDRVLEFISGKRFDLLIIDSIQTVSSNSVPGFPGSIPQIRYCTSSLINFAKSHNIPVFLIGHVTKEGFVAGPMVLSHMVDTVLYLEGDTVSGTRILRSIKNRFGDTNEIGIFLMDESGLTEVKNSEYFVDRRNKKIPGSCIAVIMEGSRPILVEIQALCIPSTLSFPKRVSSGIDSKRFELLLAVIQKHVRIPLDRTDVFLNVVGGLRIRETAADLASCMAIISSFKSKTNSIPVAVAEVGLLGELKHVTNLDKRVKEVKKMGFLSITTFKDAQFLSEVVRRAYE